MDIQHQTTLDLIQNEQKLDFLDLTQYAKYFSLLISSLLSCRNNYNCTPISRALKLDPVPNPLPPPANKGSGANLITPFPGRNVRNIYEVQRSDNMKDKLD